MAKLILVDDDVVLLELLARLLRSAGHEVVEAGSSRECLARAAETPVDLIISDVMMPEMDGYDLTQALRALEATRNTPILLLTSGLRGPDQELARASGADAYDVKTVNIGRLIDKIESVLAGANASHP